MFIKDDMFRVGRDSDHRRVCGPDCPKRPNRQTDAYVVSMTARVSDAESPAHARNIAAKALREGYKDTRITLVTSLRARRR